MDIKEIKNLATQFRIAIEKTVFDDPQLKGFPRGACGPATILVSQYLMENGVTEMKYFCGLHPLPEKHSTQSHAWVDLDGLIIDITGDQFRDRSEYLKYDIPVYVGPMDDFHKLFHKSQIHPLNGFQDYDERTKLRYSREYAKVLANIS